MQTNLILRLCFYPQVVMLTNIPVASTHPNITDINHGLSYFEDTKRNMFEIRKNENMNLLKETMLSFAKNLYKVKAVMELYERRKEFDLIVVNYKLNEVRIQGTALGKTKQTL